MKFVRDDYERKQRMKVIAVVAGLAVLVAIIWAWNHFMNKGPTGQENLPVTQEQGITTGATGSAPAGTANTTPKDIPTLVKEVRGAIAVIETYNRKNEKIGVGTGFFVNGNGHLISNYHVFRGARSAKVKLPSGTYPIGKVLAEDQENDLVLVSVAIDKGKYRILPLETKASTVGERIVVIGNPLGLEATVSDGIISALRILEPFGNVIQVTSPISPGSSGSPVLNMYGRVVGVATFQFRQGQNLNFAIPVAKARNLVVTGEKELDELTFADAGALAAAEDPFSKGMVYYEAGEFDNAALQFKEVIKSDPANVEAYYYLGMSYKAERPFDAIEAFKTTLNMKPDHVNAHYNLGKTYNQVEMYKKASQTLRRALELEPGRGDLLLELGIAYASDKELRAAAKVLEEAVDYEYNPKAYYYLGLAYAAMRNYDKAYDSFKSAVEEDSEFFEAYVGLGYCCAAFKNWKDGINNMKRAQALEPDHPEVYYLLGFMYLGNDDVDSASRQAQALAEISRKWKGKKIAIFDDRKLFEMQNELQSAISRYKYNQRRR